MRRLALKVTVVIACLLPVVFVFKKLHNQLSGANAELTKLQDSSEELSNSLSAARSSKELTEEELRDLMRLRAQSGALHRAQQELLARSANTNRASTEPTKPAPQVLPKDQWAFRGYGTPEDAFESVAWSLDHFDLNTFFASLTPESQKLFARELQGKSQEQIQQMLGEIAGDLPALRLDRRETQPNGDIQFTLRSNQEEGADYVHRQDDVMTFQNQNGQWRLNLE